MKKKNVLNLIKYYSEKNDYAFRSEAYEIARIFDKNGDYQLSEYILALLSDANAFTPQMNDNNEEFSFFKKIKIGNESLPLPDKIMEDIVGVINAVSHDIGVNKFLFEGAPGTGKTETVKQLARILKRDLYIAQFDNIVDSKLGQTSKNITIAFEEINMLSHPEKVIILFDEIDAIALDRLNKNDLREMGRATSTLLRAMDEMNEKIVFIATTNLYSSFDKALIRRFDSCINFNRYEREDLIDVAESIFNTLSVKFKHIEKDTKLFKKIISLMDTIPYPGDLKNIIKTSLAFSSNEKYNYLVKLYENVIGKKLEISILQKQGFTVREIEKLTGISKSQVSRELNNNE